MHIFLYTLSFMISGVYGSYVEGSNSLHNLCLVTLLNPFLGAFPNRELGLQELTCDIQRDHDRHIVG